MGAEAHQNYEMNMPPEEFSFSLREL